MPADLPLARLDPELIHAAAQQPTVVHTDPVLARKAFARAFRLSRAVRGITYASDQVDVSDQSFVAPEGHRVEVRRYLPRDQAPPLPVVVFFHGAFVVGDLDTEHERCLWLAAEVGCAVASVGYRRPPEHPFPAPNEDCYAALKWVHETAEGWGGDPDRIAVAGGSSGATLAASVALLTRDRGGPGLVLQMLLYPALDDRQDTLSMRLYGPATSGKIADGRWIWRYYLGTELAAGSPHAVPARCEDFAGVAPAYVLVAEIDPLRDEALDYATRMMRDGVSVELHQVARTFHGFEAAAPRAAVSVRALSEQRAALRRAFRCPPD